VREAAARGGLRAAARRGSADLVPYRLLPRSSSGRSRRLGGRDVHRALARRFGGPHTERANEHERENHGRRRGEARGLGDDDLAV